MSEPVAEKEAGPAQEPATNGADTAAPPEKRKREYKDFGHEEEKATRMCSTIFFSIIQSQPRFTRLSQFDLCHLMSGVLTSFPRIQMPMSTCPRYVRFSVKKFPRAIPLNRIHT